jgi:nitroreductase
MDFDEVVKKRKSVRSFTNKKASWKDVLEAVDAAIQGPFASNQNNLKFLIVEKKNLIEDISDLCEQDWIKDSGILIVVCSDDEYLEDVHGEHGRVFSRQQAGATIQTLMLKLTDLGLGCCWVGAYDEGVIREKLGIPGERQIEAIIPVGYEKIKEKRKPKKKLENVLYWEKWGDNKKSPLFKEESGDYRADI